ncbi:MAG TPA: tetratricopeptide repeat protein [Drouetiella sp.]
MSTNLFNPGQSGVAFYSSGQLPKTFSTQCKASELSQKQLALEYYDRGLKRYEASQLEHALTDFTAAIRLDSNLAEAFNARGSVFAELEQDNLAIKDFDEAIRLQPKSTLAYSNRATVFYKQKKFAEALADLNNDVAIFANGPAYVRRATVLNILKMHKQAVDDCTKALANSPGLVIAFLVRGQARLALQQFDLSISDLSAYLNAEPTSAVAYWLRSHAYAFRHDERSARTDYLHAIRLDPFLASLAVRN